MGMIDADELWRLHRRVRLLIRLSDVAAWLALAVIVATLVAAIFRVHPLVLLAGSLVALALLIAAQWSTHESCRILVSAVDALQQNLDAQNLDALRQV